MKKLPKGLKGVAYLYYLDSGFSLLLGLFLLFGKNLIISIYPPFFIQYKDYIVFFGFLFIAISVFSFFVARALSQKKNWARITAISFSALTVIIGILYLIKGIFSPLLNLILAASLGVACYFLLNREVKMLFTKQK